MIEKQFEDEKPFYKQAQGNITIAMLPRKKKNKGTTMAFWSLSTLPEASLLMYYHAQVSLLKILHYQKFINKNILSPNSILVN